MCGKKNVKKGKNNVSKISCIYEQSEIVLIVSSENRDNVQV